MKYADDGIKFFRGLVNALVIECLVLSIAIYLVCEGINGLKRE